MPQHDISANSASLRADPSFRHLFEIICGYGEEEAAVWLEGNEEKKYTWNDYHRLADAYACELRKRVDAPEKAYVAIAMDTCKEWLPVFWGVVRAGYNVLLLDVSLGEDMLNHMLAQAGAKALITTKEPHLNGGVKLVRARELFAAPKADASFAPRYGDSVALCTSGTTGTSRIFVYNEKAVAEQVLSSELIFRQQTRVVADEHRRTLAFLPFHHVFGFMVNVMWCSFLGYSAIYAANRAPQTLLATAQRFQPDLLVAVPLLANNLCAGLHKQIAKQGKAKQAAFAGMVSMSLSMQRVSPESGLDYAEKRLFRSINEKLLGTNLKCIILGGSHTPAEHLRTLNALGYYTVCGFGMTETAVTSVELSSDLSRRVSGSVGKPLSNTEYRIDSPDASAQTGEMQVRGAALHTGRLVDGKLTAPDTKDGWYATGDIVRLADGGRMFVEGRCKDVIINESGENVYPDELEDVFSALPNVEQFTVLGLKRGDGTPYEDIALVMNVGSQLGDDAFLQVLAAQVSQRNAKLPTLKRLTRVLATSVPLPLVNGIKVKRIALRDQLANHQLTFRELALNVKAVSAPVNAAPNVRADDPVDAVRTKVRELYAEALQSEVGSFSDDAHFIDELGGDSLQVLSAALKAEEAFGIMIPVEDYGKCTTVNDMTALILAKMRGESTAEPVQDVTPITRFEDSPEYQAFAEREKALIAEGDDNPYFVCHDSPLRDKSLMAGHEVLNFGSYNYVGMSGRPEVMEAAKAAIDKYGTSASGSRLLAGEKSLYQELEREMADWKHAEDCLVLVGGHSTNVTVVGNFCGKGDLILYDALAHNSIEQGCRLSRAVSKPFPHNDAAALESILRNQRSHFAKVLIVIEGAYSMDGDIADVPAFVALKKKYGCFLMVDEAHSACVIGQTGGGVDEYFGLAPNDVDIKMGTLSKGLGTCGGYLAGSRAIIEYLRYNLPGFVFSVGISPPLAAATLESVRLIRHNPQIMADMRRNIECFATEARKRNLNICLAGKTAIVPVMVGKDEDAFLLSNKLRERGVFVPPAVYPAVPKGKARLRFCVISEHKPEQIVEALDKLVALADELNIALPPCTDGQTA